jgi:hypothetical protein
LLLVLKFAFCNVLDEIGCEILTTDISYLKEVPPPSPVPGILTNVNVSVDILQILEIKEVDNIIKLQTELQLTWMDKRLVFNNLKEETNLNTLIPLFRESIWIPEIVFYNTEDKFESLNDEKSYAFIERRGDFIQSPREQLENAYIFKGEDNPLTIARIYDSEFLCEFDMATYPFDTQVCSIIITMKGNTDNFINIVGRHLNYSGPIDLTQYFIKEYTMQESAARNGKKALKVDLVFGRRILATILTTYLPTCLLCIVCFSTNYFKAFFFEAIVTVNLTSLLCLTTLFISVFNSLPTTSYVKMIDIWLIFNLFVPFSEVLLHTYIDSLREDGERDVNHHGKSVKVSPKHPGNVNVRDARLVDRNERLEVEARRRYYDKATARNELLLRIATKTARVGLSSIVVSRNNEHCPLPP